MEQQNGKQMGRGYLTVAVYTAGNALPVEGATVTVRGADDGNRTLVRTATTDRSGKTPAIPLPTSEAGASLTPGGPRPYAVYDILVTREGYYVHENRAAPIFAGVNSIQPVELIPLALYDSEGGRPDIGLLFSSEQTLDGEVR